MRDKLRLQRREAGEGAAEALGAGTDDDGNNGKPGNICAPMQRPAAPPESAWLPGPWQEPHTHLAAPHQWYRLWWDQPGSLPRQGPWRGRRLGFSPWGFSPKLGLIARGFLGTDCCPSSQHRLVASSLMLLQGARRGGGKIRSALRF